MHGSDGSLLWGTPSWPATRSAGACCPVDVARYVQPYVKAQKNDERDAEANAEAATRPTMRYVEIKSEAQLEVQSLHRVRGRLVAERTALINQLRALMLGARRERK